ncbi:DUF1573 domain-containing protein [candidate division WOR-3 bacterium]|nr:DUF1573 domain-containing protein [candidate division WOR-3 bacterium]
MNGFFLSLLLASAPHIEVSERSYDFGYAYECESYLHTFWIYNRGDEALNISSVRTFCGCSITELGKKKLGPGDSTSFNFIYDTRGFFGDCVKWAYISSNAPNDSVLMINVTIKLYGGYKNLPISTDTRWLDFKSIDSLQDEVVLKLKNVSGTRYNLDLLEIPAVLEPFALPSRTIGPGEEIELRLRHIPGVRDYRMFSSSINFEAWTPTESLRFSIPLHVRKPKGAE